MESLQALFGEGKRGDIHRLARLIQQHVDQQWQNVFRNTQEEMAERYAEIGDGVYGIYGTQLFRPVLDALKAAGLRSKPRLPYGNFTISREWGPEDDRQRWFWSKITSADGAALGTIAIVFYHDHIQLRI